MIDPWHWVKLKNDPDDITEKIWIPALFDPMDGWNNQDTWFDLHNEVIESVPMVNPRWTRRLHRIPILKRILFKVEL